MTKTIVFTIVMVKPNNVTSYRLLDATDIVLLPINQKIIDHN